MPRIIAIANRTTVAQIIVDHAGPSDMFFTGHSEYQMVCDKNVTVIQHGARVILMGHRRATLPTDMLATRAPDSRRNCVITPEKNYGLRQKTQTKVYQLRSKFQMTLYRPKGERDAKIYFVKFTLCIAVAAFNLL